MTDNPRSKHRRAPKATLDAAAPTRRRRKPAVPYGGYPTDLAERHLRNFYVDIVPDAQDVFHFRFTRALVVAGRRWRKLANDRLKAIGQSMARWETLYLIASSDEELSQGELARVIGVEGPTMVAMLNGLARDGLIDRYQSSAVCCVTHNLTTEKGLRTARDIMAITNALRSQVLEGIPQAKLAVTLEVLEQIHARLDDLS